jgi:predicted AlkP superfamily pyrophosphatase or phosphodiesterase
MIYTNKDVTEKGLAVKGMHGYDPDPMEMHGIFYAYGPSFKNNYSINTFELIHIYPMLCNILDIAPNSNIDGDIKVLGNILQ